MENKTDLYSKLHEYAIVGCLLANGHLIDSVIEVLPKSEMFADESIASMYESLISLHKSGRKIDLINFASEHGLYKPSEYLEAFKLFYEENNLLGDQMKSGENIVEWSTIVLEKYIKRSIVYQFSQGEQLTDVMMNIAKLEQTGMNKFFSPREIAAQIFSDLSNPTSAVKYPFTFLNSATRGMHKSQMVVVAARPSVGKTMFLENLATYAVAEGKRVLFVSAEMSAVDLGKRYITRKMKKNIFYMDNVQQMILDDPLFHASINEFDKSSLFIHELSKISELDAKIRECHNDFDLVLIDYLQLLTPTGRYNSAYEKVTLTSQQIKQIALKYHLPVVVAAQYNRATENEQPTLANLKDSGQIEQDADVVISLWQKKEDQIEDPYKNSKLRIDILKNRNGYKIVGADGIESYLYTRKDLFSIYDTTKRMGS